MLCCSSPPDSFALVYVLPLIFLLCELSAHRYDKVILPKCITLFTNSFLNVDSLTAEFTFRKKKKCTRLSHLV